MGLTCRGENFGKMAKNCKKNTKSIFWGKNSGGNGGTSHFFR